jgi:hypothetical protein
VLSRRREQFGIIARSRDADEAGLERCRLEPPSTGAESRPQISPHPSDVPPPSATSSVVVETESKDEVRLQPYNGVFAVPVVINRALRSPRFNIREMRVGEHVVRNVVASVGPAVTSDALLGQSFLSKLPSWTLDNKRHVLILAR